MDSGRAATSASRPHSRRAQIVWLVNPDAEVSRESLALLLVAAAQRPDAGIIGARILDGGDPDRILLTGSWSPKGATSHLDEGRYDRDLPDVTRDVDYVTGACLLLRRAVVRDVSLLPEEYFLYYEETDYCLRVHAAGWRTIIAKDARVGHFKRSTGLLPSSYYIYYMCRNGIYFSQRFFSADFDECVAEMEPLIHGWRLRVQAHAPQLLERFNALVSLAFEDARVGRLGSRDDMTYWLLRSR